MIRMKFSTQDSKDQRFVLYLIWQSHDFADGMDQIAEMQEMMTRDASCMAWQGL